MLKTIVIYGCSLGFLIFLINSVEYLFWIKMNYLELYIGIISAIFLGLGIWFGKKQIDKQKREIKTEQKLSINCEVGISKREFEVLLQMNKGFSNQQIAEALFVSTNTIKTHTSKIFEKLEVKNRTQAIIKAKELGIM